ncbi:TonB-dependent siderophore receptor [Acinetobacter ursingii]|uniref:TonB-dependent siderophore receptor n=1 Tax=Acinetobacter ursingii TaxID=108980 RepID=UPI002090F34F|nr:TonB-dependent siderophore receptor [Acinetobacter ursingii]
MRSHVVGAFKTRPLIFAMSMISSSLIYAEEIKTDQVQLDKITLQAEDVTGVTEGSGSYTAKSTNTSTKLNLSIRETPQTVKVYTREYLDDRGIDSFQQLLDNITGVSTTRTDERQRAYARGFELDYYLIDGMPSTLTLGDGDPDLSIFDRVEVVKGANGLMTGAGNPAIGLNMIRKHANAKELTADVTATAGSWNNFESTADISTPLNTDGSLRGRVFLKNSHEDSFMDHYERERRIAYGAIDYDLTDKTTLSFAASYQELERNGVRWGGVPAFYTDGSRTNFSRSLAVSSDWTFWNVDTTSFFAGLKQNLFNDVNLNINYSFRRDKVDDLIFYTAGAVDKATNTIDISNASVYRSADTTDENNVDVYISAPFTFANRQHEIVLGGSWNKNEVKENKSGGTFVSGNPALTKQNNIALLGTDVLDFNNMNTHLIGSLAMNQNGVLNYTEQSSAYISGKFHLLDPLHAVAGVRLSDWKYESENGVGNRNFNNEVTPYFGLVYDFAKDYSWYASYTSIFKPQNNKKEDGSYLDPKVGKSYETGIKGEFFDRRLNAALSVFRIEMDNVAELLLDENGGNVHVQGSTDNAYYGVDGVVSKGVELNVDGEINQNWGVSFGVANFEAKDQDGEKVNTTNSRTTADLFLKYKNDSWFGGIGLNYYSHIYTGTGSKRIDRDDLYLTSAMFGYKFDHNISAQINVNNIFDKKYYSGIGANSMAWGDPRNAVLTLKYSF